MTRTKKILLLSFVIIAMATLTGCASTSYMETALGEGGFGFWDIFVYPMSGLMWLIGQSIGAHNYPLTIIFATLIVRTMAWPIYAKSNDMQLKMQLIQPEIDKLEAKYANKTDQESTQRKQMEMMQLYKKNGIGIGGCLMPLVQMPIFLGFYYTIRKMPLNMAVEGHWLNIFNSTTLFGVDMTLGMESGIASQKNGIIVLAVLVGITQVVSLILTEIRQKRTKEAKLSNVPEYRRPAQNPQAKSSGTMMKVMMYVFAVMMVIIVLRSPAGLGLYWVVGNIYSTLQTWIGHITSKKRLEKLKEKQQRYY